MMRKVRFWLIKRIAAGNPILINCELDGTCVKVSGKNALVSHNIIKNVTGKALIIDDR